MLLKERVRKDTEKIKEDLGGKTGKSREKEKRDNRVKDISVREKEE